MKEMILLGAGASVEAQIPDTYKMTQVMLKKFSSDRYASKHSHILRFVVGGLIFRKGGQNGDPFDGINIEELFTAIQLLAERETSELSPFIGTWHPLLSNLELGEVANSDIKRLIELLFEPLTNLSHFGSADIVTTRNIGEKMRNALFFYHNEYALQKKFGEVVKQIINTGEGKVFRETNDLMIKKLIELVWIEKPDQVEYLMSLVEMAQRKNITIATLNYDNSIELAGKQKKIVVDTGFESWSNSGDFIFEADSVPLLKLHGSIDWGLSNGRTTSDKPVPYQIIKKIDNIKNISDEFVPAVVFGGKNKLTAKGPFLSLLRSFEQSLMSSERLTVIGYSFRDEHINEYIGNWLNRSDKNTLRIIDPNYSGSMSPMIGYLQNQEKKRITPIINVASKGIQLLLDDRL